MNRRKIFKIFSISFFLFLLLAIVFIPLIFHFNIIEKDYSRSLDTTRDIVLPPGWDWTIILIICISLLAAFIFFQLLLVFILGIKNKNDGLFDEQEDYYNYDDQQYETNSSYDIGYILHYSSYAYNLSNRGNYFVPYRNSLRDDYLQNNWWLQY